MKGLQVILDLVQKKINGEDVCVEQKKQKHQNMFNLDDGYVFRLAKTFL